MFVGDIGHTNSQEPMGIQIPFRYNSNSNLDSEDNHCNSRENRGNSEGNGRNHKKTMRFQTKPKDLKRKTLGIPGKP